MTHAKQLFAGMPFPGKPSTSTSTSTTTPKVRSKKLLLIIVSSLLLVAAVIGIVAGVRSHGHNGSSSLESVSPTAHAILKSSCASTRYPDLCYSAVAKVPSAAAMLTSKKDVIEMSLNLTTKAVRKNYSGIKAIIATFKHLTKREKTALHDCLETLDETLDELRKAAEDLSDYPNGKSLSHHANDLKTLLSAAMTNQDTCIDGFSHEDADKGVRLKLLDGQVHVEHMCGNALAMIKNMTDLDMMAEEKQRAASGRRTREVQAAEGGWPEWLSAGDRRLLQSPTVTPNVVVAADGSGNFKTVAEAVAAAPEKSSTRYVIKIKAGVYRENVEVPKKKTNIMFMGEGRKNTIITASRSVRGGSTTFHSATVAAVGERFLARDITFENTAGASNHQAVALRVGSDFSAFYQCDMLAYQDTLYVHSNRQFYINCLIAGTVDFIFGNAAAVLQDCDIHARRPDPGQKNMLTAQGRTDPNQNTGIVIQKCRIGSTSDLRPVQSSFPTYLGRPWKEYSRTVVMQSSITDVIHPAGWHEWDGPFALDTLYYGEHQNTGSGAATGGRVNWKGYRVITSATEAQMFTAGNFIGGGGWLRDTGFPFSLGL
ncbi:pectinesterase-like [Malania oleifera]|uniref:pectinesterase-like n=1 Tax=Malania oleifera TaxID=397392 RepID=UPI0025ADF06D|nr:pectinesterase-like [Malania oleifera]